MKSNSKAGAISIRPVVFSIVLLSFAIAAGIWGIPRSQQQIKIAPLNLDRFGEAEIVFSILAPEINESSGLIPSLRNNGCFWTHNDNGAKSGLFLIGPDGKHLATVQIKKTDQRDWESITNVQRGGKNFIAVGDIGDNFAQHGKYKIYLIEEPVVKIDPKADGPESLEVKLVKTIEFRYPDGPQDCEAMAFDTTGDRFWFVSKQRPGGPRASIAGGNNGTLAETAIHYLPWSVNESDADKTKTTTRINTRFKEWFVTGMDISPDDRVATIRTPFQAFVFDRGENQSWEEVFSGPPSAITVVPFQKQGESICFSADGTSLWMTSEGVGQPVWRIPLAGHKDP